MKIIECIPNFSEGQNKKIIKNIQKNIKSVKNVWLLNTDVGYSANRTVCTFAGNPEKVIEAAFRAIKCASENIDMTKHAGEHPRIGATDVMPIVPITGITMQECNLWAKKLAQRVAKEIEIPVYNYEETASAPHRKKLEMIRKGEYEGLKNKMKLSDWKPDFGPKEYNEKVEKNGAVIIGARDFLLAVNFNLNTKSKNIANQIARTVRESGKMENGVRKTGTIKGCKAIGWYIEEYGIAQVSTNITQLRTTPLHSVFIEVSRVAKTMGVKVTGTEIIGLVPKFVLVEAGKFFAQKGEKTEKTLIKIAVETMGLSQITKFKPKKRIIEYLLQAKGIK